MQFGLFSPLCLSPIVPRVCLMALANDILPKSKSIVPRGVPSPIVVPPSQNWEGNDGPWSSFTLQVGNPSQYMDVFISTAAWQTLVVVPEGCIASDPPNCIALRGGLPRLFYLNESSTWVNNTADPTSNIYPMQIGTLLGYDGKAELGFDTVGLGWQGSGGPVLLNQTVGGFAAKDSYLGLFGLAPKASNFTTFDNPIPSYLQNLRNQSLIPSTSWAYTAGNKYRLESVLGSLTLGGYDRSKFIGNDISWRFNSYDDRDLTVGIISITMSDSVGTFSLLPQSISALLDSSLPYIWLPAEACTLFEDAFGLVWDNTTELYLVNDTLHSTLQSRNPKVTFALSDLNNNVTVNITLPYAAFDLIASSPLVDSTNGTRYFPLKRATNSSQYTLGRTFFQEAYVIADYERRNFSVYQCSWLADAKQDIVIITPPTTGPPTTVSISTHPHTAVKYIAGLIGLVATIILLTCFYIFYLKPRHHAADAAAKLEKNPEKSPSKDENTYIKPELDSASLEIHEMEGKKNQWLVESDAQEITIYELPAKEEVAVELKGVNDGAVEMSVQPAELGEDDDETKRFHSSATTRDDNIGEGGGRGEEIKEKSCTTDTGRKSMIEKMDVVSPISTRSSSRSQSSRGRLSRWMERKGRQSRYSMGSVGEDSGCNEGDLSPATPRTEL